MTARGGVGDPGGLLEAPGIDQQTQTQQRRVVRHDRVRGLDAREQAQGPVDITGLGGVARRPQGDGRVLHQECVGAGFGGGRIGQAGRRVAHDQHAHDRRREP